MIPGTTPTLTLTLSDSTIDLAQAKNVYFSMKQGALEITKSGEDLFVEGNVCQVWLSQKDTLRLRANAPADIQLNWTYSDLVNGTYKRTASRTKAITITPQLLRRVVQ